MSKNTTYHRRSLYVKYLKAVLELFLHLPKWLEWFKDLQLKIYRLKFLSIRMKNFSFLPLACFIKFHKHPLFSLNVQALFVNPYEGAEVLGNCWWKVSRMFSGPCGKRGKRKWTIVARLFEKSVDFFQQEMETKLFLSTIYL